MRSSEASSAEALTVAFDVQFGRGVSTGELITCVALLELDIESLLSDDGDDGDDDVDVESLVVGKDCGLLLL
jgi:hypothetical protein